MAVAIQTFGPPIRQLSRDWPNWKYEIELSILALSGLSAYLVPLFLLVRFFKLSLKQKTSPIQD